MKLQSKIRRGKCAKKINAYIGLLIKLNIPYSVIDSIKSISIKFDEIRRRNCKMHTKFIFTIK